MTRLTEVRPCISCSDAGEVRDYHSGKMRPCCLCRDEDYEAWCDTLRPQTRRLAALDAHGRCCGRKPIIYKRQGQLFCDRCHASFSIATREQQPNWAWRRDGDAFVAVNPTSELARRRTALQQEESAP